MRGAGMGRMEPTLAPVAQSVKPRKAAVAAQAMSAESKRAPRSTGSPHAKASAWPAE